MMLAYLDAKDGPETKIFQICRNSETIIRNSSQIRNSEIRNSSRNAEIKYVNSAGIMHLIPAGIIEFPKKEI
jgi:hypothetical protein